jgi:hypothetical protein
MTYLGDHFCGLFEIAAPTCIRLGEEVLNQAQSDIVAHPIQLSVDLDIFAIVVIAQLSDNCAVCQSHQLSVDFVDPGPRWLIREAKVMLSCHGSRRPRNLLP